MVSDVGDIAKRRQSIYTLLIDAIVLYLVNWLDLCTKDLTTVQAPSLPSFSR